MPLNSNDRKWLEIYRNVLNRQFQDLIQDIVVFGSKARGNDREDSDLDILVIIKEGDWFVKRKICDPGYELSIGSDLVPSIQVYTLEEWARMKREESIFQEIVEREGISVG